MDETRHPLYPIYDSLWQESWPSLRRGVVACDEQALCKDQDPRRGMTLIARLAPPVLQRLGAFLDAAQALEPGQYCYPLADIHLTVLSLFTATPDHSSYLARVEAYTAAVASALAATPRFSLDTIGLTLAPAAVMAQGFPRDGSLARLRDRLRSALTARGLGRGLDRRYVLRAAHSTLLRFTSPLRLPERFADLLREYRRYSFGTSLITSLDLVVNDWYMSSDRLLVLKTYPLDQDGA